MRFNESLWRGHGIESAIARLERWRVAGSLHWAFCRGTSAGRRRAFREVDADLHFMEGRNQGRPLGTELAPDLLFKPRTIHGSFLHAARRPEEPQEVPPRAEELLRSSSAFISKQSSVRESDDAPRLACLSRSSHRNRSDRPSCASCRRSESIRRSIARCCRRLPLDGSRDSSRRSRWACPARSRTSFA